MFGFIGKALTGIGKAVLGGGTSFLGGLLGGPPTGQNLGKFAGQFIGPALQFGANQITSSQDRGFQREVLQNQLQWRAKDARKAGMHPTAALGIPSAGGFPTGIPAPNVDLAAADARNATNPLLDLQKQSLQAQIEEMRSRTILNMSTAAARAGGKADPLPKTGKPPKRQFARLKLPGGEYAYVDTTVASAEEIENRFGGAVGEFGGAAQYFNQATDGTNRRRYLRERRLPQPRPSRRIQYGRPSSGGQMNRSKKGK